MKSLRHFIAIGALILLLQPASRAAITGQWDFNSGYEASIGQDFFPMDGITEGDTEFGSTTSFGIPDINGEPAQVMKFPKTPEEFGGYAFSTGAAANGGGSLVNQYTIVMDVLFPPESSDKRRGLVNIHGSGDAEFAVQAGNGLGVGSGSSDGVIQPNTWHRIVFAADLSVSPPQIHKFIDGVKVGTVTVGGVDSAHALESYIFLIMDDNGETEVGYINSLQIRDERLSDGLVGALGGPAASGILTGPPPNPYISSVSPSPETARLPSRSTVPPTPQIRVVIHDGETKVADDSIVLRFDNEIVTPAITRDGSIVTVSFTPDEILEELSLHHVAISFTDDATPPTNLGTQWQFAVGPFSPVSADVALPLDSAGPRGFIARTVQGPPYIQEVNNRTNLAATVQRGIQQLNGTLRDVDGNLVQDESNPGPGPNGTFAWDGVLDFSTDSPVGNFLGDQPFPGIPGATGHSTQFTTEFLGFLELEEGVHKIGVTVNASRVDVNDDDNFALFIGLNPRDAFSQELGSYVRVNAPAFEENSQNHNEFTFYVPQAGLYPVRLVYVQSGRQGSLEFYSFDLETGERILVNDPSDPRAIKAYQSSSSSKAGAPYVAELSPQPGTSGNDPSRPLSVLILDDRTQLNTSSVELTFNGDAVSPNIERTGGRTTITFQPDPDRTTEENAFTLAYADNATPPNEFARTWEFNNMVNTGGSSTIVRGQWDFEQGTLAATVGSALEYFDGPGGETESKTQFGTASSFSLPLIDGVDAGVMRVPGDLNNRIGYIMRHGISPNGGGAKVNQYSLIFDVLIDSSGPGAAAMLQADDLNNTSDGDLFWQGNNFGQGIGGYVGTSIFTPGQWHRVAIAVDLSAAQPVVTKFVDGVKQHDWNTDGLDGRRALQEFAILFADGDADERRVWYVNSIQVREGKLSDAELVYLGGPQPSGIPRDIPQIDVAGQWDFNGNLNATIGQPLEFFDGAGGETESKTQFGSASSFSQPLIDGVDANVMRVPGDLNNRIGYIMRHGIEPNGGGSKVNQYTLIYDVLIDSSGPGAAAMLQADDLNNTSDGDLFWQGNNFGQGIGGYVGTSIFTPGQWHRVAIAVDLSATPAVVTKFVDGVKQHDWNTDGLDGRRALQEYAILFADGDADERRVWYVNSIQVRPGKMSDAQLALLGGPDPAGIPLFVPQSSITGQWDFDNGLAATIGAPLEYFDGPGGNTEGGTEFGATDSLGIPNIAGEPASVMRVPGDLSNQIGYIMRHGVSPNGGGSKVNQYTIIWDLMVDTSGPGAAGMLQADDLNNTSDGDLFWQGNNFGQGIGGYVGTSIFTAGEWHRVAIAVDLSATPPVVTKFVDGVKQDDWNTDGLDGRRALQEFAILFADGDADERRVWYVNSIQVHSRKLSDGELIALGTPVASGIPLLLDVEEPAEAILSIADDGNTLTLSWDQALQGFGLEATTTLLNPDWQPVTDNGDNTATVQADGTARFFRLRK